MFFKTVKLIYEMGRKKAYAEIVAQLEANRNTLSTSRDGAIAKGQIHDIITNLKNKLIEEGDK